MKRLILLLSPLLLAACATPRENCLASATRELATVDALILETRANLERGYAIEREPYTTSRVDLCIGSSSYAYTGFGAGWRYCNVPETRYRDKPVAIDPAAEQRKLRELQATRNRLNQEASKSLAQCDALYPLE